MEPRWEKPFHGGGASGIAGDGFPPHGSPGRLKDLMEMGLWCLFFICLFLKDMLHIGHAKAIFFIIIIILVFSNF